MRRAQARYWSITGYHVPRGLDFIGAALGNGTIGLTSQSIMDDEVVIDGARNYAIVFSRDGERPNNATAQNGISWVDWGASAEISWTLRWMSIGPEWTTARAPRPDNLGDRSDYWSRDFDPNATFQNTHTGELGPYQPVVIHMSRAEFEAVGDNVGSILKADIP